MTKKNVFCLQGRVCDRYSTRGMHGAGDVAAALAKRLGCNVKKIGKIEPFENTKWQDALRKATPYLYDVYAEICGERQPVIAASRCGATLASIAAGMRGQTDGVLVWIDAHADYHIPDSTPTGYLGGMVISALTGRWHSGFGAPLKPQQVVLAGCRDVDASEWPVLNADKIPVIGDDGNGNLDIPALNAAINGRPVWLHIDCDVLDPAIIATEYQVPKGLSFAGLKQAITAITAQSQLLALEITEFDHSDDAQVTNAQLAALMDVLEPALCCLTSDKTR